MCRREVTVWLRTARLPQNLGLPAGLVPGGAATGSTSGATQVP
jgi:hypothetical protein